MMDFFRRTRRHPRYVLSSRLTRCPFDIGEGFRNLLASVGDDAMYLPYRCPYPQYHYGLPRSLPNVIDAEPFYHTVEYCATDHINELTLRLQTLPPHFEWNT